MPGSRRAGLTIVTSVALALSGPPAPAHAASDNTVVIFDASNSMNSRFEKSRRLSEAKQALIDAARLTGVNPGLVVFGHRQPQSCRDIETLVAPNANNPAGLAAALAGVRARGVTPLASALRRAATDASHRNRPAKVVVIADGAGVKSCRINTCAMATELKNEAVDLSISVVAVAPKPEEIPSLRCIAQVTGGDYFEVRDTRSLRNAVVKVLAPSAKAAAKNIGAVPPPRRKPPVPIVAANVPAPRPKPADLQTLTLDADTGAGTTSGFNTTVFAPTSSGESQPLAAPAPVGGSGTPLIPTTPSPAGEPSNSTTMAPTPRGAPAPATPTKSVEALPPPTPAASRGAGQPGVPKAPPRTTILVKRPPAGAKAPGAARQPGTDQPAQQAATTGTIKLQAFVVENSKPIPAGLLWQIYRVKPDNTRGKLVARSSDPAPELKVATGNYEILAIFGRATNTAKVRVTNGKTAKGIVILNAGGLQLIPLAGGTPLTSDNITNIIYRGDDPRNPIVRDAESGSIIYLNAGIYKIVSRYGNVNAVARADVVVQRGKLTQAKINHRAGQAQFRLTDKAGGAPIAGATWEIIGPDGRILKRSQESTPRYILAEGKYSVVVNQGGKTYRGNFSVVSGRPASVDILTN